MTSRRRTNDKITLLNPLSSVVSTYSVRIALTIAAFNEIDVLACNIKNAYLTAICRNKYLDIRGTGISRRRGPIDDR